MLSCSHNILYYSPKILLCSHKKDTLFSQERYFVHSIYYFVPTTYHIGTGTHTHMAGLIKFCESSCLYLYKHRTIDKRQIQNKRRPESRKYRAFVCVCVYIYGINIYSPTKVKHHLTCFNNIFSNNELISNRFAVFVTCTHILTYL